MGESMSSSGVNGAEWSDWSGSAMSVIRAALAEGVVAEYSYTFDPDTRWLGGATPHRDVIATVDGRPARRDAKSARIENGEVVFARWNAKPFSVADVDFITLVLLGESTTGFSFDFDARTAKMHADASIEDVWDVPTAAMNDLMPEHGSTQTTWRNVKLSTEVLEPYRVL
jgi:hypothetical protein